MIPSTFTHIHFEGCCPGGPHGKPPQQTNVELHMPQTLDPFFATGFTLNPEPNPKTASQQASWQGVPVILHCFLGCFSACFSSRQREDQNFRTIGGFNTYAQKLARISLHFRRPLTQRTIAQDVVRLERNFSFPAIKAPSRLACNWDYLAL